MHLEGIKRVGVLALQGGFAKHCEMIGKLAVEIRHPDELISCDGLVIPGGESTVLEIVGKPMLDAIKAFDRPIFGTCAGAILLGKLGLIDIDLLRNGYGRQIHSFSAKIPFQEETLEAVFIRAPIITQVGPKVQVLAMCDQHPVLVQQGKYLAATFHPELTEQTIVHDYFLKRILVPS
ncbi:MAG: Pyridoxal 5'-phosphate synthase subunit PdxT [Chlamydiales bacterium]|nr:Pyridoxal 5'-phosphate synthase subunit PdxT [Chlamydiales bacterium]MCH9619740.1 Pyridoxal 5'-phosphate synthase subunit PdxT [Chlamydiales bacterium]MCH9623346.1 Pyridoxal 5'-phosphate synthase subunit PdxT [Chlamydiales bacterium]